MDPFPRDVQEVTLRITSEFNLIPQAMIVCATTDVFVRRLAKLVVARGGHLELKVKIRKNQSIYKDIKRVAFKTW